jgi:hypothetical protein
VQRLERGARRIALPHVLDQAVDRDDVTGIDEESGEHGPLAMTANADGCLAGAHVQRPQDPELHFRTTSDHCRRFTAVPPVSHRPARPSSDTGGTTGQSLHKRTSSP